MAEEEELCNSRMSVSNLITECSPSLRDLKGEDNNDKLTLKPSDWIEPDEALCMHYKDSDVTAHSVEQEREETSEIISEHVEVIPRYSPDAPRGTVLNPTGITLPPVMRQYVEAIVDKQWSTWRRKGHIPASRTPLELSKLSKTYHFILEKTEVHLCRMIVAYILLSKEKLQRISKTEWYRCPTVDDVLARMEREDKKDEDNDANKGRRRGTKRSLASSSAVDSRKKKRQEKLPQEEDCTQEVEKNNEDGVVQDEIDEDIMENVESYDNQWDSDEELL